MEFAVWNQKAIYNQIEYFFKIKSDWHFLNPYQFGAFIAPSGQSGPIRCVYFYMLLFAYFVFNEKPGKVAEHDVRFHVMLFLSSKRCPGTFAGAVVYENILPACGKVFVPKKPALICTGRNLMC